MSWYETVFGSPRKVKYDDGWYYGTFSASGKFQGHGEYHWYDGSWYEGEWSLGEIYGEGVYHKANGSRYSGGFIKGKYDGYGTYYYKNGCWLSATFKDGEPDYGTLYWSKDEYCRGHFKKWQLHGECVYTLDGETNKCLYDNGDFVKYL